MRYSMSVTSLFLRLGTGAVSGQAVRSVSADADDDVGHDGALGEPVVRADDREAALGDGVADELGRVQQLADGVAQVLAADLLGVDLGGVDAVDGGLRWTRRTAGTIGAISRQMCGGQRRRHPGRVLSIAALHGTALVVAEHDDERHLRAPRRRTRGCR